MEGTRTVENWLNRLSASTQIAQKSYFGLFMKWVNKNGDKFSKFTPDMLIEYQKEVSNGERYDIHDTLVQPYIQQATGTYNTKRARYSNIKSFFSHNRAELPKDPNFMIRPDREPVKGELFPDEIKKTVLASNKAYQAAFMIMFQSSMDQEMFSHWNLNGWESLQTQLDQEVIKIELPGRKSNRNKRPFYTFIGTDAIDALKNWLQERPENAQAIITNQFGKPLQKHDLRFYWTRHLRKLGIVGPVFENMRRRTGKGLHEMRDTFRTLWSKSPADHRVGEYLMGHTVDPLGYDKSFRDVEHYRKEYMKALPFLNIMSRGEAFGRVEQNEVDKLRFEVKQLEAEKTDRIAELEARLDMVLKLVEEKAKP